MELKLKGKKVVVTGGSKGIGLAIAEEFLREGCQVAIVARGEEALRSAYAKNNKLIAIQADLSTGEGRMKAFSAAMKELKEIDILVNNVGGSNGGAIQSTSLNDFKEAMELNYFSAVHLSQLVLPGMKRKGDGAIINISSIFGREAGGKATYNSAKAALISFTKALADEVIETGIRVNGVAPGSILHPSGNWQKRMDEDPEKIKQFIENEIPANRFGTVEEVADIVVFLASKRAQWVSGATLNVDGGQSNSNF